MITVEKNWTLEQAIEAHNAKLKEQPNLSDADPSLPLFQWNALHELDDLEKRYSNDPYYLMMAIRVCACHSLPMPDWVALPYIKAYDTINNYRARSWDSVFGNPFPKGKSLSAARKKRFNDVRILLAIDDIKKSNPDTPIDESLFETVGKKFGIGKTLASEYYYSAKKYYGFDWL